MEDLTQEQIIGLQHELRLKDESLRDARTRLELLEGLERWKPEAKDTAPGDRLQTMEVDEFLQLLGMGTSTHDRVCGNVMLPKKVTPEKLVSLRNQERYKYDNIYNGKYPSMGNYGATNHWNNIYQKMLDWKIKSLCDVGTARGGLPRTLYRESDIELAVGIDFAMTQGMTDQKKHQEHGTLYEMKLLNAPAHQIPFEDGKFEWVTAFDALEHLVPQEVDEVLAEFKRCASKGFILSISYKDSIFRVQGLSLHQTIRPRSWWVRTIRRVTGWNVGHYKNYIIVTKGELPSDVKPPIEYLFDEPCPKEMILLGKGPSLDKWDGSETNGRPVMAVNEAMTERPCDYGIYTDDVMKKIEPPENITLLRPQFVLDHGCRELLFDRTEYGKQVISTAGLAISIMGAWGVEKILMVGFDAYDTSTGAVYADCVSEKLSKRASSDFEIVNETIDNALAMAHIEPEWWHRQFATKSEEPAKETVNG